MYVASFPFSEFIEDNEGIRVDFLVSIDVLDWSRSQAQSTSAISLLHCRQTTS